MLGMTHNKARLKLIVVYKGKKKSDGEQYMVNHRAKILGLEIFDLKSNEKSDCRLTQ